MSRSAAVVCAYILATTNLSPSETIDFVVSRRCIVAPNTGFRKQLEQYYLRLHPDAKPPSRSGSRSTKSPHRFSMNIGRLRLWRSTSINVAAAQSGRTKETSGPALQRYRTAESPPASQPRELRVDELPFKA